MPADVRSRLAGRVEVIELPAELDGRGYLAKSFLATLDVRGVVLWIDSDIIVTSRLDDVIEHARAGRFCAFRDDFPAAHERHFPEWEGLFGLTASPRVQTYVSAGFFAFSADRWPSLIPRWAEAAERATRSRMWADDHATNPLWAGDQDALNALLMSELPADALIALPSVGMAHTRTFADARVIDERALWVEHQGASARVVHYSWGPKPWMAADWRRIGRTVYVRLLRRLLFAEDVPVRLPHDAVPLWLRPRPGRRGGAAGDSRGDQGAPRGRQRRAPASRTGQASAARVARPRRRPAQHALTGARRSAGPAHRDLSGARRRRAGSTRCSALCRSRHRASRRSRTAARRGRSTCGRASGFRGPAAGASGPRRRRTPTPTA